MTNLKILLTIIGTLAVYTLVANIIPQVQSAVPREIVLTAETTPEELVAIGEELYAGVGGCTACHGLGTRAPDLVGVAGSVCETRVPGQDCKTYLWESLVNPTAYVVEGFQPIMLDQSRTIVQPQLWALVAFLQDQGGTVTVNADDFASALAEDTAPETAPADAAPVDPASIDPVAVARNTGCFACHMYSGEGVELGPPFEEAVGKDPEYIRRAIEDPGADIAEGYESVAGLMAPGLAGIMSPAELDALIQFLVTGDPGGGDDGDDGSGDGSGE
ncbi:MAG: c-type cytochrome [Gemmatimonadota bacterium]|nr:c-type cytochrome [Gemmatimonadota bacterium]